LRPAKLTLPILAVLALTAAPQAWGASGGSGMTAGSSSTTSPTGGVSLDSSATLQSSTHPTVNGFKAKIIHGTAYAPSYAPLAVQRAIWAGNQIRTKPYRALHYASLARLWPAYDCSGSVSYVLYKAGLHSRVPDVSGGFNIWGDRGSGRWITVFGSAGHAFIEVAGIVLDTAHYASTMPTGTGPRWQPASIIRSQLHDGNRYFKRHPVGL
jgi:hypothetical protein